MDPYWRSTRAIIVHRDETNGYGLTVSGDNPVSVQTIKRGGAADLAGVREGDIIMKVNGRMVENMNHTEVVEHIRSAGAYVTLTVRPADMTSMPGMIGGNGARSHHLPTPHERVTAPLPVNHDVQLQMQGSKWRMLQAMRDEAASDADKLWEKYRQSQNPKDHADFEKAKQRLEDIQRSMKAVRQSSPNLQLHTPTPFNSSPQSHHSVSFHPNFGSAVAAMGNGSGGGMMSGGGGGVPVIRHNRNPLSSQSVNYPSQRSSWEYPDLPPPPLPPRSYSQSFSSADHAYSNHPPTYSIHDPYGNEDPCGAMGNLNNTNNSQNKNFHIATNNDVVNNKTGVSGIHSHNQQQQLPGHHNNQLAQTHHRTKSSPDPVSMKKALNAAEASRRSDSVSDLTKNNHSRSRGSVVWDSVDSNRLSPPGSPPPPYGKHESELSTGGGIGPENHLLAAFNNVHFAASDISPMKTLVGALVNRPSPSQFAMDIMPMEEDDGARETGMNSSFGHFSSLSKLLEHNAHLAVFMNYVIDNRCDPSSLLFYLITGLYIKEGNIKEMRRWAYEIHSTFTAPGSPLLVPHVDENIAKEIDDGLVHEYDKEEMLRKTTDSYKERRKLEKFCTYKLIQVFQKARKKAKEEINKQLEEFSDKRIAGLGSMFGPPDRELEDSLNDKAKEQRMVETYLLPRLEHLYEEYEKSQDDRTYAIVCAGASVLQKQFGIRTTSGNSVIEKCSSFVSKEKQGKHKLINFKNKKISYNGHHFTPHYYYSYTECNICCKLLWGIGPQGYQCLDCNLNIHRNCVPSMQDNCVGSVHKKEKTNEKFRKLKERIRPDRDPRRRVSSNWSMKKWPDEGLSLSNSISSADFEMGDRPLLSSGAPSSSSFKGSADRRPDTLSEERLTNDGFTFEDEDLDHVHQETRRASNAVGRSESCKERVQRKQTRERRKHSDPNLTSKSSDVDLDNQRHLSDANNSGSSSNSSLSARSLDSPSTSLELVNPSYLSSSSLPGRNSETPETSTVLPESGRSFPPWEEDSDIEIDQDPPDWTKNVAENVLSSLDRLEKKRQEVINELCHTERSHVRTLKILHRLFYYPIRQQQLLPQDVIYKLFANLEAMLEKHEAFNLALKNKRKESPLVGDIGPVLLDTFDGENGGTFKVAASYFCAKQQIGLELLKEKRKRDPKFQSFLLEAESHPVCRRLLLNDMIPMAMQRLTKYPLLFDNLCNCTPPESEEYKNVQRAVELSKDILNSINLAKKDAEDQQRLRDIQQRLYVEKSTDKSDSQVNELKNLDFTKHKLIYEGPLSWRMSKGNKQKSDIYDVQAVLLDDMVVLLLKENDRFVLKMHTLSFAGKGPPVVAKPVIKLHNLLHRPAAADKKAFYLVNTTSSNMYELWCTTTEERKIWLHHITKATEDYKNRQQESRREINPNIPPVVPEPEDKSSKEVGEAADASADGNADGGEAQQGTGQESSGASPHKDASPAPDTSSNLNSTANTGPDHALSPDSAKNSSVSPSPVRRKGEFLRVTESAPLVDPSEVVVATRDVHFAQPVVSQYEELKRVDATINKLFDEKQKLVSKIVPIPTIASEGAQTNHQHLTESNSMDASSQTRDAKDLVAACIQQVDQLGRILASQSQKLTNDNLAAHREQFVIQKSLSNLLTQLLSEVRRRDDDIEQRRQEIHRLREQNHGYQERLQKAKVESQPLPAQLMSSPVLSPSHSRPNSFLSVSSSSDHHDDDPEVVMKTPLKAQLSAPVASSNSNRTSPPEPVTGSSSDGRSAALPLNDCEGGSVSQRTSACDVAPEGPAEAVKESKTAAEVNDTASGSGSESKDTKSDKDAVPISSGVAETVGAAVSSSSVEKVPEEGQEKAVAVDVKGGEPVPKANGHGPLSHNLDNNKLVVVGKEVDVNGTERKKDDGSPLPEKIEIIGECPEAKLQENLQKAVDTLADN